MIEKKVSVIIPSYNRAYCIEQAIRSVLVQTYTNLEIIVVDDNSEDCTEQVVESINDERIKYIKNDINRGPGGARNIGIACATGELIAFQDSDDYWYEDKLQQEIELMEQEGCGLVFCKFKLIGNSEVIIPYEDSFVYEHLVNGFADILMTGNRIGAPTIVVDTEIIRSIGGFDESLKTLEDWDIVIRLALKTKVGFVNKVLMDAYSNENGVNGITGAVKADAEISMVRKFWNLFPDKNVFYGITHSILQNVLELENVLKEQYFDKFFGAIYRDDSPLISVVVPIYNSEKYLKECLDSILDQPIKNMEVLCVNDGSTDTSIEILRQYETIDTRVKIICKENSGYGDSVNIGIAVAKGKYIALVESDDIVVKDAFAILCAHALVYEVEVAKGNYNLFYSAESRREFFENLRNNPYDCLIYEDGKNKLYSVAPSLWSGIYSSDFLEQNKISFLATPGASYQDTSFAFKVWACAKRIILTSEAIIDYRQDNDTSSSNETKKVFNVLEEFRELESFIEARKIPNIQPCLVRAKYASYNWNAMRLRVNDRVKFWLCARREFTDAFNKGYLIREFWNDSDWSIIHRLVFDFESVCFEFLGEAVTENNDIRLLKYVSPLYIFGAGIRGHRIANRLADAEIILNSFIVSDDQIKNNKNLTNIIKLSEVDRNGLIIIGVSEKFESEIIQELHDRHMYNYIKL